VELEHSRALRLAAGVSAGDERSLLARQEAALVTVRFDPRLPMAALTARVLLTTLRRLPGRLALDASGLPTKLVTELVVAVAAVDSRRPLDVVDGRAPGTTVGLDISTRATDGFIRVVPEGFGGHVVSDDAVELVLRRDANALGAVFAAACGAAEAFKRIVVDKPGRATSHPHLRFCPVTLSDDPGGAPSLTVLTPLDLALVGNGAIGTAVALILCELALGGRIVACDPERFEPENRGTYSLGGEREAQERPRKVDLVGDALAAVGYEVVRVAERSTALIERVDGGELAPPRTVLTGLDSVEARRETQMLWPDDLVDAATGDTALGLHHALPTGPCLRCFFPQTARGPDPLQVLARETGLPVSRLKRGTEALSAGDLAALSPPQRQRLAEFIGRPVCGLADALGLTDAPADGYLPSVPFVSQMGACLAVGRLLALALGVPAGINFIQFDALHGPTGVAGETRVAARECFCQRRGSIVRRVRATRWPNGREP
jgi:hypothetical protein